MSIRGLIAIFVFSSITVNAQNGEKVPGWHVPADRVAEALRFIESQGYPTNVPWDQLPEWQVLNSVRFVPYLGIVYYDWFGSLIARRDVPYDKNFNHMTDPTRANTRRFWFPDVKADQTINQRLVPLFNETKSFVNGSSGDDATKFGPLLKSSMDKMVDANALRLADAALFAPFAVFMERYLLDNFRLDVKKGYFASPMPNLAYLKALTHLALYLRDDFENVAPKDRVYGTIEIFERPKTVFDYVKAYGREAVLEQMISPPFDYVGGTDSQGRDYGSSIVAPAVYHPEIKKNPDDERYSAFLNPLGGSKAALNDPKLALSLPFGLATLMSSGGGGLPGTLGEMNAIIIAVNDGVGVPVLDASGRPVLDPKTGRELYRHVSVKHRFPNGEYSDISATLLYPWFFQSVRNPAPVEWQFRREFRNGQLEQTGDPKRFALNTQRVPGFLAFTVIPSAPFLRLDREYRFQNQKLAAQFDSNAPFRLRGLLYEENGKELTDAVGRPMDPTLIIADKSEGGKKAYLQGKRIAYVRVENDPLTLFDLLRGERKERPGRNGKHAKIRINGQEYLRTCEAEERAGQSIVDVINVLTDNVLEKRK